MRKEKNKYLIESVKKLRILLRSGAAAGGDGDTAGAAGPAVSMGSSPVSAASGEFLSSFPAPNSGSGGLEITAGAAGHSTIS